MLFISIRYSKQINEVQASDMRFFVFFQFVSAGFYQKYVSLKQIFKHFKYYSITSGGLLTPALQNMQYFTFSATKY